MPDESRFNGISEALEEDEEQTSDSTGDPLTEEPTDDTDSEISASAGTSDDTNLNRQSSGTPAFSFDEATQRPLYARESAWAAFEDTLDLDVGILLRREYDVRDVPKRELHDAALRVVANHPDEVAAALLEQRGVYIDDDEGTE